MPLDQLNIRTEEIDEILGKTPNNIIRWGVSVLFFIIIILLIGSWFFKYPDTIVSTIELTTLQPPSDIVAKSTGKLDSIFIQNNEHVFEGQLLATIENPANYHDIKKLSEYLKAYDLVYILQDSTLCLLFDDMELGELQSSYSMFISSLSNYQNYMHLGYSDKKIAAIETQIEEYQVYYSLTEDQKQTLSIDFELAEKDYKRHLGLYNSHTIAEADLEQAQSVYLSKKYTYENIRSTLANINIQISQLENSILDLELQFQQQEEELLIRINESYDNLRAQLDIWEQRYLLTAPMNGDCVFTKYWSSNQNVTSGEKIMTIIPSKNENIIGKLLLPVMGSGKVKVGQRVNIRLHNYPYMEFGMLEGNVHSISSVPKESFYYVEVVFPNGMITNYNLPISFSQNMQGSAEIITDDIRILYRIMQPIRSVLTNRL